jgi:cell division protein ZapA (FtsZ GTPase activity inhibitor)
MSLRRSSKHCHSLALAVLAALRFVLELLVVEEKLFTRREHEIRATIDAL